jgi:hypothetical protein
MRAQSSLHALVINPIIYAEVSFSTLEALDDVVGTLALTLREIPQPALFLAAKAVAQYRGRGGSKLQVLPDCFIGAQACLRRVAPIPTKPRPSRAMIEGVGTSAAQFSMKTLPEIGLRSKSGAPIDCARRHCVNSSHLRRSGQARTTE